MNTTYSQDQIQMLLAAGIDLNEFFGAPKETPKAEKKAKKVQPEGLKAAKKHCYEARVRRFETTDTSRNSFLRSQMDQAIDALVADGTIDALLDQHGYEGVAGE